MRRSLACLIILVFFLGLLGNAWGQPKKEFFFLAQTKDPRYLEKDPEKRRAFFEALKKEVELLKQAVKNYKPRDLEERKILKEAQDLFESLPILWQKIEFEISQKSETETFTLPELQKSEYTIADFQHFLALGFQLRHELEALKGKLYLEEQELERTETTLEEVARDCFVLVQEKFSPETYLRLAEFLNLQARWALDKLAYERTSQRYNFLKGLRERWESLIKEVFARLNPTPEEIEKLTQQAQQAEKAYEALKAKNQKLREKAERDLALIEIRLTRLKPAVSGINIYKSKYYETRKNYLETIIQKLDEEETLANLNKEYQELWASLALCLSKCARSSEIEQIERFEERLKQLDDLKEGLKYRLEYLRERSILIKNNLALHKEELRRLKDKQKIYYLSLTIQQENKLVSAIEELNKVFQKELELVNKFSFEGETIVHLWKTQVSTLEKAWVQIKRLYQKSAASIKGFLFYPLWKVGETNFTVLDLFKVLFILIIGIIVIKLAQRRLEAFLIRKLGMAPGVVNSLSTLSYYAALCLVVIIALSSAGINMSQVALIFGALSVGIGFGLQTIANNFVSGIILLSERSIKVGDLVQLEDGTIGVVEKINIRSTVIRTFDALEIIVPNSEFVSQRISTWTYEDDWRRIIVPFGVAYGTDPEKVKEVAIKAARSVSITREDQQHPIRVRFTGFGESSLDFELAVWIRQSEVNRAMTGIKSDYYYALYQALTEAGIEIPFPQRDIHLRSVYPEVVENLAQLVQGTKPSTTPEESSS